MCIHIIILAHVVGGMADGWMGQMDGVMGMISSGSMLLTELRIHQKVATHRHWLRNVTGVSVPLQIADYRG